MKGLRLALLFLASGLLVGCDVLSSPEVHLIPEGTVGDVFILPGYPSGVSPKREGLARVYEIPSNRILVTQDLPSPAWHWTRFYYVDSSGLRRRLQYEPSTIPETPENLEDDRPVVWFERGIGEIRSVDLPCPIRFVQYYVGTRADLLSRSVEEANEGEVELEKFVREHHVCP